MIASRWVVIALLGLYGATALPRRDRKHHKNQDEDNDLESTTSSSILMVSGYWKSEAQNSGKFKYGTDGFPKSMSTIMNLNVPTVVYGDEDGLADFQAARSKKTAPLLGIHKKDVTTLEPCKTHGDELRKNEKHWTHPVNSPSINLGCAFDGKISLLSDASRKYKGYDFYAWMDVGTPFYNSHADVFQGHRGRPWPHPDKLAKLPTDKISVAHSGNENCDQMADHPYEFWHCVSGTTFVVPAKLMGRVNNMFYTTMNQCIDFWKDGHKSKDKQGGYGCFSDSMLLSIMAREHPDLFNWIGTGWTAAAANLTSSRTKF